MPEAILPQQSEQIETLLMVNSSGSYSDRDLLSKDQVRGLSEEQLGRFWKEVYGAVAKEVRNNPILQLALEIQDPGGEVSSDLHVPHDLKRILTLLTKDNPIDGLPSSAIVKMHPGLGVWIMEVIRKAVADLMSSLDIEPETGSNTSGGRQSSQTPDALRLHGDVSMFPTSEEVIGLDAQRHTLLVELHKIIDPSLIKTSSSHVLFVGNPGTGKTVLVKSTIREMHEVHGSDITSAEIVISHAYGKYRGMVDKSLKAMFDYIENLKKPFVGFLEELDMNAPNRSVDKDPENHDSEVLGHIIRWMDRIKDLKLPILLIGNTNRPDNIDKALLRPGRFTKQEIFRNPKREALIAMFKQKARVTLGERFTASDALVEDLLDFHSGNERKEADNGASNRHWTGATVQAFVDALDDDHVLQTKVLNRPSRPIDDSVLREVHDTQFGLEGKYSPMRSSAASDRDQF